MMEHKAVESKIIGSSEYRDYASSGVIISIFAPLWLFRTNQFELSRE